MTARHRTLRWGLLLVGLGATAAVGGEFIVARQNPALAKGRPVEVDADGYVGSAECRSCHPNQYDSWHRSYHRTMTQVASPESIQGDFDDVNLELDGGHYHLTREGDEFWVEMDTLVSGSRTEREQARHQIVLVTGSHHMQVYWFSSGRERELGQLPFSFLIGDGGWVPRRATFVRPPNRPRHTGQGRWNQSCLNCHSTHGRPRIGEDGTPDTEVVEFGISCEACHGPGGAHVRANLSPLRRYRSHLTDAGDDTVTLPRTLDHERGSEVCGHCHGIYQFRDVDAQKTWLQKGFSFRPGGTHAAQYLFQPSEAPNDPTIAKIMKETPTYARGQFWSDGESRTSGREYNGMIMSGCFTEGEMSCGSCHTMHATADDPRSLDEWANDQLGHQMDTNQACLNCHGEYGKQLEAHTHHDPESEGSRCYNCHMPHTSYGLLKGIRSHKVDSPTVTESATTGRPNACNLCHLDKTLGWTARRLSTWYGITTPMLIDDHREVTASVGWALGGDPGVRSLIAWHMGWEPARKASGGDWMVPYLGVLMDDPYDAVRHIAERSLRRFEGFEDFDYDAIPRPNTRDAVTGRVIATLERRKQPPTREPEMLLLPNGAFNQTEVDRLIKQRGKDPFHLLE